VFIPEGIEKVTVKNEESNSLELFISVQRKSGDMTRTIPIGYKLSHEQ
jgi:Xaa-Pro aminopeptidase